MGISKKIKKVICCTSICACVLGIGVTSYADTSYFTLTLSKSGVNDDNISLRTIKADNENAFYLTPTYISEKGPDSVVDVYGESRLLENQSIRSNPTSLNHVGYTQKTYYNCTAPSGKYYYLKGIYGRSISGRVTVEGRYTP